MVQRDSIPYTLNLWLISVFGGSLIYTIYIQGISIENSFKEIKNVFELTLFISFICSLPVLVAAVVINYLIFKSALPPFLKKITIALSLSILIAIMVAIFIIDSNGYEPSMKDCLLYGLSYWFVAMAGILFFKIEKPDRVRKLKSNEIV